MTAVITGAGVVSAFGLGRERFLDRLAEGAHAVGPIRSFDASTFPVRVAAEVPVPSFGAAALADALAIPGTAPLLLGWEEEGRLRDRKVPFLLLAAVEAWRQAGCGPAERSAWLSIALGLEQALLEDFGPAMRDGAIRIPEERKSRVRYRVRADLAADCLRELLDLSGPSMVHASACAAGGMSVAHAASLIARGSTDLVVCGGADAMINPLGLGGMTRLAAPSPRNEPDACRPFDRRRDGLVMGEGAAVFVVESAARASARGAKPLAVVLGGATTQDGWKITAPRPDGAAAQRAMARAIASAGVAPEAIGYVNAHGTGTPLNDPAESRAILGAFGPHGARVPVSSIKGAVGHLMAASGAIEIAACLLPLTRDLLPGTAHHKDRDPECGIAVIGERPVEARVDAVLSNSFGFGGQNVSVVLGRAR